MFDFFNDIEMKLFSSSLMFPMWHSIACGFIIGLEREIRNKDAGIKTSIFLCVSACLFTYLGVHMPALDQSRITAQIVSGVGFLGAGVIYLDHFDENNRKEVKGLTSASIIWKTAAIGCFCGIGKPFEAYMASATLVALDLFFTKFQRYFR